VDATISFDDADASHISSLYDWLQRDDEFRGRVEVSNGQRQPGEMGHFVETLTLTLISGGAMASLARTLSTWLSMRRVSVVVELSEGKRVRRLKIQAGNAAQVRQLLEAAAGDIAIDDP
jgi:hypothetical protein